MPTKLSPPRSRPGQTAVRLSQKYQVVIPRSVRRDLEIRPGQRFEVFEDEGVILLVPVQPLKSMRGFLKGMNADVGRQKVDRL